MLLTLLKAKLHGATVTEAQLDYEGSLTIDRTLMDLVGILPWEKIMVANLQNGNRFETYAIPGTPGAGTICLNGATAHLGKKGDKVIIFTFCQLSASEAHSHHPLVVRLDPQNRPEKPPVRV
ncbi:MAG: aspartate 1-decarboxylase [bacterium]